MLFNVAPFGILFIDATSGTTFANLRASEILGKPIPTKVTREGGAVQSPSARFSARIPEEERPDVRAFAGRTVPPEEVEIVRVDGTRVRVEMSAAPVPSSPERPDARCGGRLRRLSSVRRCVTAIAAEAGPPPEYPRQRAARRDLHRRQDRGSDPERERATELFGALPAEDRAISSSVSMGRP